MKTNEDDFYDEDVVRVELQEKNTSSELIPYLYANGILKKGQLFECSRWGIQLHGSWDDEDAHDELTAIHEAGHATLSMAYGHRFEYA